MRSDRITRAEGLETGLSCSCSVCQVGHMSNTGNQYMDFQEKILGSEVMKTTTMQGNGSINVCSYCLCTIGRGKPHPCTRRDRRESLDDLVKESSAKTRGRVLSSQLKDLTGERGVPMGKETLLPTGGAPLPVMVGRSETKKKPSPHNSTEKLLRLQNKLSCSDKKIKEVAKFVRFQCGKSSVEPNLNSVLKERNHLLEEDFVGKKVLMLETEKVDGDDDKENEKKGQKRKKKCEKKEVMKERPAVFAKDVEELIAKIMMFRNLNPLQTEVQIGIDDGQGQLKVLCI